MANKKTTSHTLLNIGTGLFLGLLIGILLGLSISQIVGAIAGVFVAAAAVFMGFSDKIGKKDEKTIDKKNDILKLVRTISLSIACIGGLFLGIWLRAHNILGTSALQNQFRELKAVGFTEEESLQIIKAQVQTGEIQDNTSETVLYLFKIDPTCFDCTGDHPDTYDDKDDALKTFELQCDETGQIAELIRKYAKKEDYEILLRFIWDINCGDYLGG